VRLSLLVLALLGAACNSLEVRHDFDEKADFAKYRTYRFLPPDEKTSNHPLVRGTLMTKRVYASVQKHGPARGLEFKETGDVDLLVAYHALIEDKVDVISYDYRYGARWAGDGVDTYEYQEGTLTIDFIDARSKEMVWRGWAVGVVRNQPDKAAERIDAAVAEILQRYPPN
jgi:hypothetical protein